MCLVKPQFEAGREKVGKKGVVRDPAVHLEVLETFLEHAKESNFTVLGITYSAPYGDPRETSNIWLSAPRTGDTRRLFPAGDRGGVSQPIEGLR